MFTRQYNFSARLLFFIFISILIPFFVLTFFLRTEIRDDIFEEKQDKLFGLTRQLDHYLEGTFDDLLAKGNALSLSRDEQIDFLNQELREVTDFVASGNPGVGVGYYAKKLDGVLTYGPSEEFEYTVGTSIDESHEGLAAMEIGEERVQIGELVRGNIMNCMHPIIRDGKVIGYIWANETVDRVQAQLARIMKRVYLLVIIIFGVIYLCVYVISRNFLSGVTVLKTEIENLMDKPNCRIPEINGELNIIGETVNELVDNIGYVESHIRYILDAVVSGVLVVSNDGVITHANRKFYQLFKHLDNDVHGKQSRGIFGESVKAIIDGGLLDDECTEGKELNLSDQIIKVLSNFVIDEQGKRLGLILIFQDMTLIRQYQSDLREKEKIAALGEMSLGVAHEIKNPLTSVKGFTQMLQRPTLKEEKRVEYLQIMDEELNRVNRLLNDLLLYGGQSPLKKQDEDLMVILDGLISRHQMVNPDIMFEKKILQNGDFIISLDKYKIIQVFENIIKNSVDALDYIENGRVTLALTATDEDISIAFKDNGKGIMKDNFSKIYNPFFTTKDSGTGFGLAICYRIVKRHGGDIVITSVEGEFTEVTITLNRTTGE
jgi:two-component system, NtrC family, sensor histidine kinase AtoS